MNADPVELVLDRLVGSSYDMKYFKIFLKIYIGSIFRTDASESFDIYGQDRRWLVQIELPNSFGEFVFAFLADEVVGLGKCFWTEEGIEAALDRRPFFRHGRLSASPQLTRNVRSLSLNIECIWELDFNRLFTDFKAQVHYEVESPAFVLALPAEEVGGEVASKDVLSEIILMLAVFLLKLFVDSQQLVLAFSKPLQEESQKLLRVLLRHGGKSSFKGGNGLEQIRGVVSLTPFGVNAELSKSFIEDFNVFNSHFGGSLLFVG